LESIETDPEDNQELELVDVTEQPIGIKLVHTGKTYKKRKKLIFTENVQVLDDLSLDIRQSEIFTLLGHNGAGKTTTVNIITGLVEPSVGTVTIDGLDIEQDIDAIRRELGVCPQV
jgi:ABC-type multidrug transport system ATPase subunit